MLKKIVAGVLVALFIIGGSFSYANAQSMSSSQLVDLFISLGIITPEKAGIARDAVKNTSLDGASIKPVAPTSSQFSVFLNSTAINRTVISIDSVTDLAQEIVTAVFDIKLKALDGDYIFSTNEDAFKFALYFNGAKVAYANLNKTVFATLPSTGVVTKGLPAGQFKLLKNREVSIPVTFQFFNKLTDGMFIERGLYAVGVESVTGINRSNQKVVADFMAGNSGWRTYNVSVDGSTRIVTQPSITVISPNGGEVYKDTYNLSYTTEQIPVKVTVSNTNQIGNLKLYWTTSSDPMFAPSNAIYIGGAEGVDNININPFTEYRTTSYANLKPGNYYLYAEWIPTGGTNIGVNRVDISDSHFQIASPTITPTVYHSADTNKDWKISDVELEAVTGLYNYREGTTRTGEYHVEYLTTTSSTGNVSTMTYVPGPGTLVGPTHSADSNKDWKISLLELTRVIELKNAGGYTVQAGTEDGFAPVFSDTGWTGGNVLNYQPSNTANIYFATDEVLRLINALR